MDATPKIANITNFSIKIKNYWPIFCHFEFGPGIIRIFLLVAMCTDHTVVLLQSFFYDIQKCTQPPKTFKEKHV